MRCQQGKIAVYQHVVSGHRPSILGEFVAFLAGTSEHCNLLLGPTLGNSVNRYEIGLRTIDYVIRSRVIHSANIKIHCDPLCESNSCVENSIKVIRK